MREIQEYAIVYRILHFGGSFTLWTYTDENMNYFKNDFDVFLKKISRGRIFVVVVVIYKELHNNSYYLLSGSVPCVHFFII